MDRVISDTSETEIERAFPSDMETQFVSTKKLPLHICTYIPQRYN